MSWTQSSDTKTPDPVNIKGDKMKFSDLTAAEKDLLKLKFADLTAADKESLRGAPGTSISAEWSGTKLIIKNNGTAINSGVDLKGEPGKTFRPVYDPVTKKMTFSASSDTSAVIIDNIATVDMVEKLQLVSDKDGNFKLVQHGGAATTDTVLKVSDFTDKKVFESSISNVNGKFEAYLTKSSAASLLCKRGSWYKT